MNKRFRHAGFTLLEILVVMVLTAMIVTVLMQGLQQAFRIQTRLGAENFWAQQGIMHIDWFRDSINGLMPDYADGQHQFKGASRRLSGLTTAALDAPRGAMVPFVWRIDFDPVTGRSGLYYGESGDAPALLDWPGNNGRFVYLDPEDGQHDEWPPFLGKQNQIPRLILLEIGPPGGGARIVAYPRGPAKPWPRQRDFLGG